MSLAVISPTPAGPERRLVLPEGQERLAIEREADELGLIVDGDDAMLKAYMNLRVFSSGNKIVLLRGETGTGKEPSAIALHGLTERRSGTKNAPFYAMNCASISDGLFESELFGHVKGAFTNAHADRKGAFEHIEKGGTLFLDEVGDLPLDQQAKLLRVLETRKFRLVGSSEGKERSFAGRVVCATSRDLEDLVRQKKFRTDLYFRITAAQVALPPLAKRSTRHAEALISHFARHIPDARPNVAITPEARSALAKMDVPGNVRGLKNYLERAYLFAEAECEGAVTIDVRHVAAAESPVSLFTEETTQKAANVLSMANGGITVEAPMDDRAGMMRIGIRLGTKESENILPAKLEDIVAVVRGSVIRATVERAGNYSAAAEVMDINRSTLRSYVAALDGLAGEGNTADE